MNVVSTALLTLIYLSFISLGLPDSMLGSAWPAMTVSLNAPLWGAGLIQMLISFCTIISSLNSARLIRKFGTGGLTAISVATTALALLGFSLAKNYAFLLLMAVPLGLGAGAVDAGLNNYVALHCGAKHMSWLHCFWGVGTIIGPMILSAVLRVGGSWKTGYRAVGLTQCAVSALLFATLGMWKRSDIQQEEREARTLGVLDVLRLPGAKAGMMTFFGYCAVESTLGLWGATYISQVRGVSEATAASFGAMFYIGITVGRAASGFMAMKLLPKQMVRLGQALLALGCHLCRTCQAGKCNWGIATQRPELVKRLNPEIGYQRLVNLVTAWNHEIMEMMGGMGINSIESMRGNRLMLRGIGLTDRELAILGVKHAGE